ncbi:MAG: hypothetical protein K1X55_12165, partial [Chitinophagales bacterium]|nr:hypothetical protein [Chitinophagales bacterium]
MKTKSFLKPMLLFLLLWMISLKTHSQIIVDSFDIDYPECTNCLLPEQEGPAMTITVKHYRLANLPASGNAAVIFVPGGGFIVINPQGLEDPNPNNPGSSHNIDVAKHLALDSVHVWSVSYTISNSLDLTKMVTGENCGMATQFSKGDFEFASLKAFWSFRKLLSEFKTDSFPAYGIDTNKVFLVGHSAGAILSIYSTFLGANDMPTQLMS